MAEPFTDFVIPPLLQTAALLVGTGLIVALLYAMEVRVTQKTVLAFTPWIVIGAILHVFYQLGRIYQRSIYPAEIEPLFSAPAVYLTTFIGMGFIWVISAMIVPSSGRDDKIVTYLTTTGIGVMLPLVGLVAWQGMDPMVGPLQPIYPILGLVLTLVLTAVVWVLVGLWRTYIFAEARYVGAFVIFGHLLDAITTTIGIDILGAEERSVIPAMIMDFAAGLPTAEFIGTGWLFIVVKLVLAVGIVVLFADYVSEKPTQGNIFFAVVGAVGLGPGVHNFFLFLLGVGA